MITPPTLATYAEIKAHHFDMVDRIQFDEPVDLLKETAIGHEHRAALLHHVERLAEASNGLLGLLTLFLTRNDLPVEVRATMQHHHRITAMKEALSSLALPQEPGK